METVILDGEQIFAWRWRSGRTQEQMAEQIRTSWERSLGPLGEETPQEREERQELARQWHALRKGLRSQR